MLQFASSSAAFDNLLFFFLSHKPAGVCATKGGIPVVPLPSSAFLLLLRDLEVDGMNVKPSLQRFLGRPQLVLPKSCANGSDAQTSAEESHISV